MTSGEVIHDGNFLVMDGMVLSDGSPTPSLYEFKAVVAPVDFAFDGDKVAITNLADTADTSDLRFRWRRRARRSAGGFRGVGDPEGRGGRLWAGVTASGLGVTGRGDPG
ncbi:hypothetical protein ACRAWF_01320 [Streptomyces sp. L7]